MDASRTASTPSRNDNGSLSREGRNPDVRISELGFSAGTDSSSSPTANSTATGTAAHGDHSSLSPSTNVLNISFADEVPELRCSASELIDDGNDVRFQPLSNSFSTTPSAPRYEVHSGREEWEAELQKAQSYTFEAIDWYREWRGGMQGRAQSTLDNSQRLLTRLFTEPVLDDPLLGRLRPPVLPELLRPDIGKVLIYEIADGLRDLGDVAGDLLCEFRAFAKWVCEDGAYLRKSGVNLRQRYGVLVCPLGDRDIKRRKVKSKVFLPRVELLLSIFEAIYDWAVNATSNKWTAWGTATVTTLCFETGMRGVEVRHLCFEDHPGGIFNPLNVRSAKNTSPRNAQVNPWGWNLLND